MALQHHQHWLKTLQNSPTYCTPTALQPLLVRPQNGLSRPVSFYCVLGLLCLRTTAQLQCRYRHLRRNKFKPVQIRTDQNKPWGDFVWAFWWPFVWPHLSRLGVDFLIASILHSCQMYMVQDPMENNCTVRPMVAKWIRYVFIFYAHASKSKLKS